jgi:glycerol-3-phosphate dehydrogenase
MSALVTRGCGEMRRLGLTFGARSSTISGLSGEFCGVWVVSYFSFVVLCCKSDRTCFLLYR